MALGTVERAARIMALGIVGRAGSLLGAEYSRKSCQTSGAGTVGRAASLLGVGYSRKSC